MAPTEPLMVVIPNGEQVVILANISPGEAMVLRDDCILDAGDWLPVPAAVWAARLRALAEVIEAAADR